MAKRRRVAKKFRTLRSIQDDQYVVFRTPRSKKLTKFKAGKTLIGEVRSRKSKKLVGYLNSVKIKGKKVTILPRKFTKSQISIKTRKAVRDVERVPKDSFLVTFRRLIMDQVRTNGKKAIKKAIEQINTHGDTLLGLRVDLARNNSDLLKKLFQETHISELKLYTEKDADFEFLVKEFSIIIINLLRSEAVRTSLKNYSTKKTRRYYNNGLVTVLYGSF